MHKGPKRARHTSLAKDDSEKPRWSVVAMLKFES
jgi:hypothetical protein